MRPTSSRSPALSPAIGGYGFGPFKLYPQARRLFIDNKAVRLGARAFDLLAHLVVHAGEVQSKDALIAAAWPQVIVEEANLRVQLVGLRKALEVHGGHDLISNVPGRGYVFTANVSHLDALIQDEAQRNVPVWGLSPTTRLPGAAAALVGRRNEVNTVVKDTYLRRLVTVAGPGGIGKTSVAVAAARIIAGELSDGAVFVDLSTLATGDLVASAVAAAVGVSVVSGDPLANAIALLQGKHVVLVLDNCDPVLDATVEVVQRILAGTTTPFIVATSREPLRIEAESVHRLPPLASPPEGLDTSLDAAMQFPAIQLFVQRALAIDGAFQLSDDDAPGVALLCRRLDGMPLAIELAAARTAVLGVSELVQRLDDRLKLLKSDRRSGVPRHRTLEATLDWSFQLLGSDEQRMLTRLAIFRERFSLEWALAVAADDAAAGIEALAGLVSKSLISVDASNAMTPYRLLETTRCYAMAKLLASGEGSMIAKRHAFHVCALLGKAVDEIDGLGHGAWREKHAQALDDVRCALDWALAPDGDTALASRIAALSATLWMSTSMLSEYLGYLERLVELDPGTSGDPSLAAQVWGAIGFCRSTLRGPKGEAYDALGRALASAEQSDDLALRLPIHWTRFTADILNGRYADVLSESLAFGEVVKSIADPQADLVFHRMMALSRYFGGAYQDALRHAELAIGPGSNAIGMCAGAPSQLDHRVAALTMMARTLWTLGQFSRALGVAEQARARAVRTRHVTSLIFTLSFASCPISLWCGEIELAANVTDELRDCCVRHGIPFFGSWFTIFDHALELHVEHLAARESFSAVLYTAAHAEMSVTLDPLAVTDDLVRRARDGLCDWCAPEILRSQAHVLLNAGQLSAAQSLLDEGIALATAQGALAWKARLVQTQAEALIRQGREADAAWLMERLTHEFSPADRDILLRRLP
ncbi:ATP-binding protein [Pandoraea sp. PE-S2T-3]|uniref:ATP-binding protein n=1 Tax=Pandoraea sp. PE-S2T-3 TaxID=1986993 RepID=UPI000B3F9CB5|nr:winged helix-turn-helix domain-containing protein [Pandoraea sp. PE-S2T-3]